MTKIIKHDWTMSNGIILTKGLQVTVVETTDIHDLYQDLYPDVLIHVNISGVIFPFVVPDILLEDID